MLELQSRGNSIEDVERFLLLIIILLSFQVKKQNKNKTNKCLCQILSGERLVNVSKFGVMFCFTAFRLLGKREIPSRVGV